MEVRTGDRSRSFNGFSAVSTLQRARHACLTNPHRSRREAGGSGPRPRRDSSPFEEGSCPISTTPSCSRFSPWSPASSASWRSVARSPGSPRPWSWFSWSCSCSRWSSAGGLGRLFDVRWGGRAHREAARTPIDSRRRPGGLRGRGRPGSRRPAWIAASFSGDRRPRAV